MGEKKQSITHHTAGRKNHPRINTVAVGDYIDAREKCGTKGLQTDSTCFQKLICGLWFLKHCFAEENEMRRESKGERKRKKNDSEKKKSITPKEMERVSAWWNNLPKQTRKRTKKGVLAAAAALGGVLATGGALCVAVDCSPALQRHILATFVDRGTQTRVTLSPTATLQWDRAEFALWRGRVTLHNVTYEARKHERTNELFLRARAARVALGLRPVCTLRRLLRYVDVSDLDATLDLRPATTFLRSKSAGSNVATEQHSALAIDSSRSEPEHNVREVTPVKLSEVENPPRKERADFTIGLLRIRNAVLNLITPFVFVTPTNMLVVLMVTLLLCSDQVCP